MMMNTLFRRGAAASQQAARRDFSSTILRQKMETVIAARQAEAKEFKKEYGKKYVSKEEEFHRRKIFLENLLYIGKSKF